MGKYNHLEVEAKHQKRWEELKIYDFQNQEGKKAFVIDTPPPTVSGDLHIGHIFSYTQTDILARFHRMRGKNVFYPMGWDDNGLPTEKRAQNLYAVQCDPALNYDPSFKAKKTDKKPSVYQPISRKNFLEICQKQVLEDEIKYKKLWNHIALSVDWRQSYQTISPYAQSLAQLSFLDLYQKNLVENNLSPVLWDTQFQTAVAQADVESREQKGFYHNIAFLCDKGKEFIISSTRPELLPACVAVTAHPEDERYKSLLGQQAITPLFYRRVPILPSFHADPKKGTGILMICSFGDMEDADFIKKHDLPVLQVMDNKGCFKAVDFRKKPFLSEKPEEAHKNYSLLKGLRAKPARKKIAEILREKKLLKGEPKECLQNVKFYEKGEFPLEILPKRQWHIKILDHKEALLQQGKKINWHPPSMRKRYEQWVEGLNQNWCISRQRFYGVPFPVWHKINDKGETEDPLWPPINPQQIEKHIQAELPIDPIKQTPRGFSENQRGQPGGFRAETDVMDTWAISSLTPYINSGWLLNREKHKRLFPADLRPQAHEIIRTWAFYTIAKAYFHEKKIPWKNIAISGWILTPEKMKMSKSKGQTLAPENLIKTYSADSTRYWTAKARLGQDTVYDENLFKTGKRLAVKIFNASRFVQIQLEDSPWTSWEKGLEGITAPIDQAWLKALLKVKASAIQSLKNYDHAGALELIEKSFWSFCDSYLELIKARVYQLKDQPEGLSGKKTLDSSLYLFLKLFAPYFPYVTEEIWQSRYNKESPSIHNSLWLTKEDLKQAESQLSPHRQKSGAKAPSLQIQEESKIKTPNSQTQEESKIKTPNSQTQEESKIKTPNSQTQEESKIKTPSPSKKDSSPTQKADPTFNDNSLLEKAFAILKQIHSQKSDRNKSLACPLKRLELKASSSHLKEFELYKEDIARASHVPIPNIDLIEKPDLKTPVVKAHF